MINYKPALIAMIYEATNVNVVTSYPDVKLSPIIIMIEDSNEQIRTLDSNDSNIEAANVELTLEVYSDNKSELIDLSNNVDKTLTDIGFIRNGTDEGKGVMYVSVLKYKANMYQTNNKIIIN